METYFIFLYFDIWEKSGATKFNTGQPYLRVWLPTGQPSL